MLLKSWIYAFYNSRIHRPRKKNHTRANRAFRIADRTEVLEDRTLLAAALVESRVVTDLTPVDPNGETENLPVSEEFVDEYDVFFVELWVATPATDQGVSSATVDLRYNPQFVTAVDVTFGPAFDDNLTSVINDQTGLVTDISGTANRQGVAADLYSLLAVIEFVADGPVGAPVQPGTGNTGLFDLGIGFSDSLVELDEDGPVITQNGIQPASDLHIVPYDFNDNGGIGFDDFSIFAGVFRDRVDTSESAFAGLADFNNDNEINFGDFSFFAANFRQTRESPVDIVFPVNYPQSLRPPANRAPVFDPVGPLTAHPGGHLEVQLSASDPDGDEVTFSLQSTGPFPNSMIDSIGRLIFTPGPDQSGTFDFTLTAGDGLLQTKQQVTLTVENDPVETTRISGTVFSTTGDPLVGVPIELGRHQTTTAADGSFTIELTPSDFVTAEFDIIVPVGDPHFDPFHTGEQVINVRRSRFDPLTGTSADNPRRHPNLISSFLDASTVYGSDAERAEALRTNDGTGRLLVSSGDLLPLNNATFFPDGPLENANRGRNDPSTLFVAGDVRAAENSALSSLHTILVREHNRLADEIATANPGFSGDDVFFLARKMVGAILQRITYQEFLPVLLGDVTLSTYTGYDPAVNPGIINIFSTAAFRFGHSQANDSIFRLDSSGNEIAAGHLSLNEATFDSQPILDDGIDPILRGIISQIAQNVDTKVIDELRNLLFGPPGVGGIDLSAINIQRGRDHGLPDYNQARIFYGLPAAGSFADITSDVDLQNALRNTYGNVNNIDAWVGGLAEDHVPNGLVGELFATAIRDQFERLRDGDRFWYENGQFTPSELQVIRDTSLTGLIERNSGITGLLDDVFTTGNVSSRPAPAGTTADETVVDFRTFDGFGNNVDNPDWGVAGANLLRGLSNGYADGISVPGGTNRPSARVVSNNLFSQSESIPNAPGATSMLSFWGQLIAHDLDFTPEGISDTLKIHGDQIAGEETYPFVAEKVQLLLERDIFPNVNNVIARPIFLPALDVAGGTDIDPLQDTMVEQEIAPGEMAMVEVKAGTLEDREGNAFDGVLSITEVPPDLTPAALPENLFPDAVVTIQPGEMVFTQAAPLMLPNRAGWAPGTIMDLWSINPNTGEFDNVGTGQVTADGKSIETIDGGVRNSSWHFFTPPIPDPTPPDDDDRTPDDKCESCKSGIGGSEVHLHSGILMESHDLIGYQSQGVTRGLTLTYDSQRADPRHIIHFGYDNTGNANRMVASLTVSRGTYQQQLQPQRSFLVGVEGAPPGSHFWGVSGGPADGALQVDLGSQPSGSYDYQLNQGLGVGQFREFGGNVAGGVFIFNGSSSTSSSTLISVNTVDSPFGSGWGLSGLLQLVENPDGSVLIIDGDGEELLFEPLGSSGEQFNSPPGDFSTLERLHDGTFRRTFTDKTVYSFNDANVLASIVDRNDNETQYLYDSNGLLEKIVDPSTLETLFSYSSGRVSKITDPSGRETHLEYDADGNLTRIIDPDGVSKSFEYDDRHLMTREITPRGLQELFEYGFHGRVTSLTREDGTQLTFNTTQVQGLFPANLTSNPLNPPAALNLGDPVASYTDGNGELIEITLDKAGQEVVSRDAIGETPQIERNGDNLITTSTDARGNPTFFTYDANGNLLSISDAVSLGSAEFQTEVDPLATLLVDTNGDGILDLVTANGDDFFLGHGSVSVILGNGNGTFGVPTLFATGTSANALSAGDVDGDGNVDLVTANLDHSVSVLMGRGNGTFDPATDYMTGASPESVIVQDLNGDGALDIATADSGGETISVLFNNGDGTFPAKIERTDVSPVQQAVVDLNGDGLLDVVTANSQQFGTGNEDGSISVLLGIGDGTFLPRTDFRVGSDRRPSSLAVTDVNKDGLLDSVVVSNNSNGEAFLAVLTGNGSGSFSLTGQSSLGSVFSRAVETGDFNEDGNPDAIVGTDSGLFLLQGNGDGTFGAAVAIPGSAGTGTLLVEDINGDNKLDLLSVPSFNSSFLQAQVLLGNGNGTFTPAASIILASGSPSFTVEEIRLENVDDNGTLDLVAALGNEFSFSEASRVVVLPGNEDGTFGVPQNISIDDPLKSLAVGDVDGDGDLDVVTAQYRFNNYYYNATGVGTLSVLLGDGMGTFTGPTNIPIEGPLDDLFLGDSDGDGNPDVIGTSTRGSRVAVGLGNGAGNFAPADSRLSLPTGENPQAVASGDIDGDGDLDLVTANGSYNYSYFSRGGGSVSVLLSNGDGTFADHVELPLSSNGEAVALGDLDRDGNLDLAVALEDLDRVAVFLGEGNGNFLPRREYAAGEETVALSLRDTDGDGNLDIVAANADENSLSVLLNNGDGTFPGLVLHTGSEPVSVAVGDLDQDGVPDLVTANANTGTASIIHGNIDGTYQSAVSVSLGTDLEPAALSLVDLNGDGLLDLVTANGSNFVAGPGSVSILLGNQNGTFDAPTELETNISAKDLSVGDVNDDGNVDLVTSNGDNSVSVLTGNGDGTFAPATDYRTGSLPESVELQDWNQDGDLDIVTADFGNDTVSVLLNNGDGTFPGRIERTDLGPVEQVVVDLNGDSLLDVITANSWQFGFGNEEGSISVLLGIGDGTFQSRTDFSLGDDRVLSSLAVDDVNKDGLLDTVVVSNNSDGEGFLAVLTGNGGGSFSLTGELSLGLVFPQVVRLGDFNEDGNPDAIAGADSGLHLLSGNEDGTFAAAVAIPGSSGAGKLLVADINSDNNLDLLTAPSFNSSFLQSRVLLGNGDGTFSGELSTTLASGGSSFTVEAIRLEDGDENGTLDLFAALSSEPFASEPSRVAVLSGNGDGTFGTPQNISIDDPLQSLAVGDVDGNGDLDVVASSFAFNNYYYNATGTGTLSVLLGDGMGSFSEPANIPVEDSLNDLFLGDTNGDGNPDVIGLSTRGSRTTSLQANGNGNFAPAESRLSFPTGKNPQAVTSGDIDGDGDLDLVTANGNSNYFYFDDDEGSVSLLLGNGNGTFANPVELTLSSSAEAIALGDLNGDSILDLAVVLDLGRVAVFAGIGDGSFLPHREYKVGEEPVAISLHDTDGDNDLDIVIANSDENSVSVLLNNGDGTFPGLVLHTGSGPESVAVGDLDGNGIPDLVTANEDGGSASIILGNPDGTYQSAVEISVGPDVEPLSTILVDTNDDGNLDLVTANESDSFLGHGSVSVLLGDGNGTFADPDLFPTGTSARDASAGDVNGDGFLDLVTANEDNSVSVLPGNGDGTFNPATDYMAGVFPTSVSLQDLNGDGALDIVTGDSSGDSDGDTTSILLNNGDGTFPGRIERTDISPVEQAVVDLNGDGLPDVVIANDGGFGPEDGSISVLLGIGNGTFQPRTDFMVGSDRKPRSLAVGDVDKDDLPDTVVVSNNSDGEGFLAVLTGNGSGSFSPAGEISLGMVVPNTVAVGDFDKDGNPDVVVGTGEFGSELHFLPGNGDGTFGAPAAIVTSTGVGSLLVDDINGDNNLDLLTAPSFNSNFLQAQVLLGNGDGTFAAELSSTLASAGPNFDIESIELGNVDGDGSLDLVVALRNDNLNGSRIAVLPGNGNGTFGTPQNITIEDPLRSLTVGDVDGDGDLDVVAAAYSYNNFFNNISRRGNLSVLLGDGMGTFANPITIPIEGPVDQLFLGDTNGDGIPDGIGMSTRGSRVAVRLGDGTGNFAPADSRLSLSADNDLLAVKDVVAGDLDGDGDLDLVAANGVYSDFYFYNDDDEGSVSVLLGNGDATFADPLLLPLSSSGEAVALGDLNGDGILDLAVVLELGRVAVFLGTGDGNFLPRREYAVGEEPLSLSLHDTDGDNDLDVVIANSDENSLSILLNNGDGTFPGLVLHTGPGPESVTVGDLDDNGTLDLVTANADGSSASIILGNADGTYQSTFDVSVGSPTSPVGKTFTYDPVFNQLTSSTDELGRQTLFEIDSNDGNVISITQVVGFLDSIDGGNDDITTLFTYTADGLLDTSTDPLGRVTDNDYDPLGRLVTVTSAKGTADEAVRQFEYDAAGNRTAIIDANGNRTEFRYDLRNRITRIIEPDPDGGGPLASPVTTFVYDTQGNVIRTTDSEGNKTVNKYDLKDRLIKTVDPDGGETLFTYDSEGNLTSVTDPLGNATTNSYDARNRLIESVDPDTGTTKFGYDLDDNLLSVEDPLGNVTRFAYDARNRLVGETDPLGQFTVNEYDTVDNLIRTTDRNGRITEFQYDDLDRLVTETWVNPGGSITNVIEYSYDAVGNLFSVTDDFSALAFTYDNLDRPLTVDNTGTPDVPPVVLTYTYDAVGNVLSLADTIDGQAGAVNGYTYDALNRLIQIQQTGNDTSDKRVDFTYNALGQFTTIDRFSDLAGTSLVVGTTYTYDSLNRLVDLRHNNGGSDVAFYAFTYDASSRITSLEDIDGLTTYTFDDRDQLLAADHADGSNPDETYTYDVNGNRVTSFLHGNGYVTGAGNRLLSDGTFNYQYDNEGNLIRRTEIATGDFREFEWDHRNRLIAVTDRQSDGTPIQRVEFIYDAFDRRISKSVDTTPADGIDDFFISYVYDGEDVLLDFTDADGHTGAADIELGRRYLHGPGTDQVLAQDDGSGSVEWLLADHLGTTRDLVDNAGVVLNHIKYDSFGNVVSETNSTIDTHYLFTGREFDEETGLYFYRARYYDATTGRFIAEDPIGFEGSDLNLFRYVNNEVTSRTDPSGNQHRLVRADSDSNKSNGDNQPRLVRAKPDSIEYGSFTEVQEPNSTSIDFDKIISKITDIFKRVIEELQKSSVERRYRGRRCTATTSVRG